MREIRFRAWDGSEMHYGGDVIIYLGRAWLENMSLDARVIHVKDTPPLIALQFTGLHDKNGKEIYEGDIIRGESGDLPVKWRGGFYLVRPDQTAFSLYDGYELEVVGNIYETPEPLK